MQVGLQSLLDQLCVKQTLHSFEGITGMGIDDNCPCGIDHLVFGY